jgi:hypothetical protein
MMNIQAIATAAVTFLAPYLAKAGEALAKSVGEQLLGKMGDLYRAIKKKFKGDNYAEQTLVRVEEKPESEGRQVALAEVLADKMEADSDFAHLIRQLVEEIGRLVEKSNGEVIKQRIDISGKAGDIIQVGRASGGVTMIKGDGNVVGDESESLADNEAK